MEVTDPEKRGLIYPSVISHHCEIKATPGSVQRSVDVALGDVDLWWVMILEGFANLNDSVILFPSAEITNSVTGESLVTCTVPP